MFVKFVCKQTHFFRLETSMQKSGLDIANDEDESSSEEEREPFNDSTPTFPQWLIGVGGG